MTNKRNVLFSLVFVMLLFQACQESPTQVGKVDDSNLVNQQTQGPDRVANDPPFIGDDDDTCFENPNDLLDVILDCEDPGGGGPGSGGTTSNINMMYLNQGVSNQDLYYSINTVSFSNPSQISWSGNVETPNTARPQLGPTGVFFNGRVYAFYQKCCFESNDIWFSSTSISSINWTNDTQLPVANGAVTTGSPAAIVYNGVIYVFFANNDGTEFRYTTSTNGTTWSNSASIPNNSDLVENPYPVVYNNQLHLFYTKVDTLSNGFRITDLVSVNSTNGSTWTINTASTPGSFEGTPVVLGNQLHLIYMDGSNNLRSTSTTNVTTWSSSVPILSAKTQVRPTAIVKNGYIILLYKGATQNNIHMAYSNNGTTWFGNTHVPGQTQNAPYIVLTE